MVHPAKVAETPHVRSEGIHCPGHDNKLLHLQNSYQNLQQQGVEKMSKLETIARVAVGIVVIGTLWPIGLFGDD